MADEAIQKQKLKKKFRASLILLLVAVISITTATYAWFSLSNTTVVQDMTVQVATGVSLKASTKASGNMSDYVTTITNEMVNTALGSGYELDQLRLWPLTSGDGVRLYTQSSNTVSGAAPVDAKTKSYLELKLWFMATTDMNVYLNGDNSPAATAATADGTLVSGEVTGNTTTQQNVAKCTRISFTPMALTGGDASSESSYTSEGKSVIYEPNKNGATTLTNNAASQGGSTQNTFDKLGNNAGTTTSNGTDPPVVFSLKADTPKLVVVRLWIEGQDPECINDDNTINIEKAKLLVRLRFCGADDSGNFLEVGAGA